MGILPLAIFNPMDTQNFVNESSKVLEFIANYYKNIEKYPVRSQVEPGYLQKLVPDSAPDFPDPLEAILEDVRSKILPGLTHWQSPNFFAYFQANASTAGFLGEMLCAGLNVVGFNWISSPAATELETIVMDWMGKLVNLPETFLFSGNGGGVLQGSTCEAMVCTLVAARDRFLKEHGADMITKLVVYGSDQTHFSLQKAGKIVGIPPANFRAVVTSSVTFFALAPNDVRVAMEEDLASGLVPLYLCATIGTTGLGAVDPLEGLGQVARDYGVWLHVDAAYAGNACVCPEFQHYLNGVELADSISMNLHKWFLTNMDGCCLWVKYPSALVDSLSTSPEILRNVVSETKVVVDYKDWQIALSRRFRAIKVWVMIRMYGVNNLMDHIRSDVQLANQFETLVKEDKRFELVVPRKFALVCFRLRPKNNEEDGSKLNGELLEAVNSSGQAFMTHAVAGGTFVIRCAIGGTLTEERHIHGVWKLIQRKAELLQNC